MKLPRKTRHVTMWLDKAINDNAGWLIAAAIVFFSLTILARADDNRRAIEDLRNIAVTTRVTAEDTKKVLSGQGQAVQELKADNEQQTRILCRLILRDNELDLQPDEEAEIERICQEEIDRQDSSGNPEPSLPNSSTPEQNQNNGGRTMSATPDTQNPNDGNSEEPEEPGGLRSIPFIDGLLDLLGL